MKALFSVCIFAYRLNPEGAHLFRNLVTNCGLDQRLALRVHCHRGNQKTYCISVYRWFKHLFYHNGLNIHTLNEKLDLCLPLVRTWKAVCVIIGFSVNASKLKAETGMSILHLSKKESYHCRLFSLPNFDFRNLIWANNGGWIIFRHVISAKTIIRQITKRAAVHYISGRPLWGPSRHFEILKVWAINTPITCMNLHRARAVRMAPHVDPSK